MALPDLATVSDLSARGVPSSAQLETMLTVASSIVRSAAGSPILQSTSTVSLTGWGDCILQLPGRPVRSVSAVTVDALPVTDWKLTDSSGLWRSCGWGCDEQPAAVSVTMIHGLPKVPAHIVNLVCDLAIAGATAASTGAIDPRVVAEKIDDYSVQFATGAEAVSSVMELPALTRRWLAAQFGGGAAVVTTR